MGALFSNKRKRVRGVAILYMRENNTFVLCGRNPCLVSKIASVIAAAEASV